MHHHIHIVYQYPLLRGKAFVLIGCFTRLKLHLLFHKVCDGPYLCVGICFANNEEIGHCFGDLAQVQGYDIFPLFILNGLYDGGKNLTVST